MDFLAIFENPFICGVISSLVATLLYSLATTYRISIKIQKKK